MEIEHEDPHPGLFAKYIILDAKTGTKKDGHYFCLRLDTNDPLEHDAVTDAILAYANKKRSQGFKQLASDLVDAVNATKPEPSHKEEA